MSDWPHASLTNAPSLHVATNSPYVLDAWIAARPKAVLTAIHLLSEERLLEKVDCKNSLRLSSLPKLDRTMCLANYAHIDCTFAQEALSPLRLLNRPQKEAILPFELSVKPSTAIS
jgi:hypothetical protein